MIVLWVGLALIAAAGAAYFLLARVTAEGGAIESDAAEIASQILAEADGYRGSRSAEDPPWDGKTRLAPPTTPGGEGFL